MTKNARLLLAGALCGATVMSAAPAQARTCPPIDNPYAGTRYEGSDLRGIRANGLGCGSARSFVKRAHYQALGMTPPPSGVRRFTYRGWRVTGDLRGATDRYVARRGGKSIRWLF